MSINIDQDKLLDVAIDAYKTVKNDDYINVREYVILCIGHELLEFDNGVECFADEAIQFYNENEREIQRWAFDENRTRR